MLNRTVKILDCTLRDGGYVLDWNFKEETICSIIAELEKSNIDFIECGYLKEVGWDKDKTLFNSVDNLLTIFSPDKLYTLMVNCGEYDVSNFNKCQNKNIKIRLAFKKNKYSEAIEYISHLKNLGWDVFVNPMNTNLYSQKELEELISDINIINPFGVFIVDTFGNMNENEVKNLAKFMDKKLNSEIILGLHTHNSMNLAYKNALAFLSIQAGRTIIIDSCLYGMGRCAGNLKTEIIARYLNKFCNNKYNLNCLHRCINENLLTIYKQFHWGYSVIYHLAAILGCHPNYANYLIKHGYSLKEAEKFLKKIPAQERKHYNDNIFENLNIKEQD